MERRNRSRSWTRVATGIGLAVLMAAGLWTAGLRASSDPPASGAAIQGPPVPISGVTSACDDFAIELLPFGLITFDIADEGWVWVNPARKFRSVSGRVSKSHVAYNDTPANHNSHDHNTKIVVDPGQEDILSIANDDDPDDVRPVDTIEMEWETGVRPGEKKGDGAHPTFPKWAWPSVGDRVWVDGSSIFDCGHPEKELIGFNPDPSFPFPIYLNHYRAEIHPARAIAAMRDQAHAPAGDRQHGGAGHRDRSLHPRPRRVRHRPAQLRDVVIIDGVPATATTTAARSRRRRSPPTSSSTSASAESRPTRR